MSFVACVVAAGTLAPPQVAAQTIELDGTRQNVNPLSPPGSGRCAPAYFNTVEIAPGALSSTGTSNIGPFASTQSHCITSPPPTSVVDGEFTYTFRAGDTITGTYSGTPMPRHIALPGLEGPMFVRWLDLFRDTLGEFDNPAFTAQAEDFARRIARSLWYGYQISHQPDQPVTEFDAHVPPAQY